MMEEKRYGEKRCANARFFRVIKERRSVRHYDASFQIPREELNRILQEATLAPSSHNLQPWRFLVIHEAGLKEKLLPIAYNQKQVVEASDVIAVMGIWKGIKKPTKFIRQRWKPGC